MKCYLFSFMYFVSVSFCFAQSGEFKIHPNGLMYNETTMKQLSHIVDSLNLKFKVCDLNRTYYSANQAKAHYITLKNGDLAAAKKDMENGMPFDAFLKKYPQCTVTNDLLVIKSKYKSYQGNEIAEISSVSFKQYYENKVKIAPERYKDSVKGKWIFSSYEKSNYSDGSVYGFYFLTEFEAKPLPHKFARMVQYADCLIDTSTQIFKENPKSTNAYYSSYETPKEVEAFNNYVKENTNAPKQDKGYSDAYWRKYEKWNEAKFEIIDTFLSKQPKFRQLLREAVAAAIEKGSSDEFEEYVARYYSKKTALDLKRSRIVMGSCSMDESPRVHAMNIAVLSAEAVSWETFLRAHLDIMNDRFQRASDGSYAWAARETYIRELEELDINVPDLIFGISLRVDNPSENHYYGNIGRIGRALAESQNAKEIEESILTFIKDNSLDDYNRVIMYYLFVNYNYYIKDEKHKKQNTENLKLAVKELPVYLSSKIKFD